MCEAVKEGQIFVTATGCKNVITESHILKMKNMAVLCNIGRREHHCGLLDWWC